MAKNSGLNFWTGFLVISLGITIISIYLVTSFNSTKTFHRSAVLQENIIHCPRDRAYVLPNQREYTYYRPELSQLTWLKKLDSLKKEEIPDFEFADVCQKYPEPGCERLDEIRKEQEAIFAWNQLPIVLKVEEQNQEIDSLNKIIISKNHEMIDKENELFGKYPYDLLVFIGGEINILKRRYSVKDSLYYPGEEYGISKNTIPSPIQPRLDKNTTGSPLQSRLTQYLDLVDLMIKANEFDVDKRQKANEEIIIKNEEIKKKNQEIALKNEQALQTAEKFWTVEKKKELLDDYGDFIKNNCVGCDYAGRIPASSPSACTNSCPNRKYVDGYCVLK